MILRLYWLFPTLIFVYALFGNPNTPDFEWWALLAAISCGLPLIAARYNPLSLICIWALIHVVYYPLALFLNLIPDSPGVYEYDLWAQSPSAMAVASVGMIGLTLGCVLIDSLRSGRWNRPRIECDNEITAVSSFRIMVLVLLIVPLVIFKILTGTYWQYLAAGVEGFSYENAITYGYVGYLEYIACAGIFIQIRRFLITRSKTDFILAFSAVLLPIILFLPSGSRDVMLRVSIYPLICSVLGLGQISLSKRMIAIIGMIVSLLVIMWTVEAYRGSIYHNKREPAGLDDRLQMISTSMTEILTKLSNTKDVLLQMIARRLADYVVVGKIVDEFSEHNLRGLENVHLWPVFVLPNFFRPEVPDFDAQDSPELSKRVGVRPSDVGSSPCMILGDLYSRFSWPGVLIGMAILGLVWRRLDIALEGFGLSESLFFGLIIIPVTKLTHDSIFSHFLFFSRAMIIIGAIFFVLRRFLVGWKPLVRK